MNAHRFEVDLLKAVCIVATFVPWLAGIAGPLALAAGGRALLGPRSRTILGA
jgi:hypothetical protein